MRDITIIGDGAWGTAIAILLHNKGYRVTLWGAFPDYIEILDRVRENAKFLPGVRIPPKLRVTASVEEAVKRAEMVVCAVPTPFMRSVLKRFRSQYDVRVPMISVAKGIENRTLMRGTEIIRDVLGEVPVGVLSGPSHAEEVGRGKPTIVVAASKRREVALLAQRIFSGPQFRVYTNTDPIGVELGGALKQVVAIAAGICDGLGLGDNAKSALLTRGLAEMGRLGVAMGARRGTFAGLSGMGDLITTSISPHGRNRWVGEQISRGHSLAEVRKMTEKIAEGIWVTKSAMALAERCSVEMPITREVYRILYRRKDPRHAVADLMGRSPKPEIERTR
jgi:glycerol-3-phosphate dehydrogenase (NAD(P)+)